MSLGIPLSLSAVGPGDAYPKLPSLFGNQDSHVYLPGLWEQLDRTADPLKTAYPAHSLKCRASGPH